MSEVKTKPFFENIAETWLCWTCELCNKGFYCKMEQDMKDYKIICAECLSNELLWETRGILSERDLQKTLEKESIS